MPDRARHVPWNDLPWEEVVPGIRRRIVNGDGMMMAQVFLDAGAVVPKHSHMNEQFTYILEGALRFRLGEALEREVIVRAGEVLHIPAASAARGRSAGRHARPGRLPPAPRRLARRHRRLLPPRPEEG
jgi:hypothetical protein